jgi:hypothetical protein
MIAKLKTVAAVAVIALLTLAGAAGAVAKVVPLEELKLQWQQLKLQGIFRIPRFQSPFRSPLAAAPVVEGEADVLADAARSVATDAAVQTVVWLGNDGAGENDRPRMRPGGTAHRRRGLPAPTRLVAQLVSTVVSSNLSAPTHRSAHASDGPGGDTLARRNDARAQLSEAPLSVAAAPVVPRPLPPHRTHRAPTGGGIDVAVAGRFAGGAARASGAVTTGHEKAVLPLVPPARMNDWMAGGPLFRGAPRSPTVSPGGSLTVGGPSGSRGTVRIERGALAADTQVIGEKGHGEITHSGGDNVARAVRAGVEAGSKGTYNLNNDNLYIKTDDPLLGSQAQPLAAGGATAVPPGASPGAMLGAPAGTLSAVPQLNGIEVGHDGTGEFNIGNRLGGGQVSEYGQYGPIGGSLVVRGGQAGSGLLRGTGLFHLRGFFDHNGRVIADGYGQDRTLEFSGFKYVGNTFDNPSVGGTNGWFARDHGQLVLPNLRVRRGTGTYTWGEDPTDPTIDLVNSVRVTIHDAAKDGPVRISLLSQDRGDVPSLPQGHTFIGVWKFEDGGLEHGPVDLLARYDDTLAEQLGIDENFLKLWAFADGAWYRINDGTFTRDVALNLIGGRAEGLEYFAVSAPEPSTAAVLLVGGAALLLRRRRTSPR